MALINVGASLSNINILAGGTSAFTRDVTTGGNSFTDDIKRHLGVSREEAEALKVAFTDGDASADVARVLQMTAQQMAGEFQKSIDFFLASHPDTTIGKIYLSGGSARVPPLLAAIEQRARVPVEIMEPFRDAGIARTSIRRFCAATGRQAMVSLGLALRVAVRGDKSSRRMSQMRDDQDQPTAGKGSQAARAGAAAAPGGRRSSSRRRWSASSSFTARRSRASTRSASTTSSSRRTSPSSRRRSATTTSSRRSATSSSASATPSSGCRRTARVRPT